MSPPLYLLLDIFGYLSVVLRGLILIAQSFTLGGIAFQLLLWRPLQAQLSAGSVVIGKRCQTLLRLSAFGWGLLTIGALALNAAAQVSWSEAASADFARADLVIAACALGVAFLTRDASSKARSVALLVLSLLALAMQLKLTHAASRLDVRWPLLLSDTAHMLGAAVWIGGLPYFLIALNGCQTVGDWRLVGRRYSLMSMASVAAIIFGGTAMAIKYIGSADAIYGTAYGVMTSAKVGLLLMLLALGGATISSSRSCAATPARRSFD
jgi:copper resistance protein D